MPFLRRQTAHFYSLLERIGCLPVYYKITLIASDKSRAVQNKDTPKTRAMRIYRIPTHVTVGYENQGVAVWTIAYPFFLMTMIFVFGINTSLSFFLFLSICTGQRCPQDTFLLSCVLQSRSNELYTYVYIIRVLCNIIDIIQWIYIQQTE